jgi:two-component system cell cycle sensor histidine kinase/response regulator CckA
VRQSAGHIWVQSTAQGTTFKIYFPREAQSATQNACERKTETLPGMETLVLAEDESATRELIARVLASSGYRVLEAANGRDALGFFEQPANHVDLLITDLVMPVMGGGELARKAMELSPRTKVLYISGFSDDPNVRQGVLEGAAYLQKPFRLEILNCKVRELLDRPPLARMA